MYLKIITACDGISALNKVGVYQEYIRCSSKHIELVSIISSQWDKSVFTPIKFHVYGHQDDLNRPLTVIERHNCDMNTLTSDISQKNNSGVTKYPTHITYEGLGAVICHDKLDNLYIQQPLYYYIHHHEFCKYISQNQEIT